jgi:GT2 family glycosyltransferase
MISVVIPTRDRPQDLSKAVESILCQTTLPGELIIIDQSPDRSSRDKVEALMSKGTCVALTYVLDQSISGLVEAKHLAACMANGDIVCFLEDDVVLESTFLEEIVRGFKKCPCMLGCCGVITNPPPQPMYYDFMFHIFHRGIYRDKRVGIYGNHVGQGHDLIESKCISGGLSAWRKEVFAHVSFDLRNGFHMYEDIDFSTRVAAKFGNRLFINPNARLAHYCSPINRLVLGARQRRKMNECVTFYRTRKGWAWAGTSVAWLIAGCLLEAALQSIKVRSADPLAGCYRGIVDGFSKTLYSDK